MNGGVPPFGHKTRLRQFIDPELLQYEEVGPLPAPGTTCSASNPTSWWRPAKAWSPT